MHVAFLSWRDTTHPDGGGSEVFVERVARGLVSLGHEVTIFCAAHENAPADCEVAGVRFVRRGGRLTVYPRGLSWLLMHRRQIDSVVDVINGLPFASPLVRRRGVVALVHHVHHEQWRIIYPGWKGRLGWFVEGVLTPALYRRRPHITVSNSSREDLVRCGIPANGITVVHNGVDPPSSCTERSTTPRLCVLARLVPHKQIEHAFAALEGLACEIPDIGLDVIGEGWWRDRLEDDLRQRQVGTSVILHGRVSDSERDRLLGSSWLMLLPSVKEGWGLAIMEAAAQGTPTIAYRSAGGVTEAIVDGVTGVLADEGGLEQAVRTLVNDPARCRALGEAAKARAMNYDWSATIAAVEQVLLRCSTSCRR